VQPCFRVVVLTLEAEGVFRGGLAVVAVIGFFQLAPGAVVADPGQLAVAVGPHLLALG
jgi:hypothetical protein